MTTLRDLTLGLAAVSVVADAAKARKDELRTEVLEHLETVGADAAKAQLPDGTPIAKVSIVAPASKASIADENAFTGHVAKEYPTEVIMRVRESFQRGYLDSLVEGPDGTAVDPQTGEVVPGVRFSPRNPYASVRFTPNGRDALIAAIRSGDVPLDLTGAHPQPSLEQ